MKAKLFPYLAAITWAAGALSSPRLAAAVTVYGEASSSGAAITVNVFADIPKDPLVSFGVRVVYDPKNLYVSNAAKNTEAWYFSDATGRVPYMDPEMVTLGEVLIIGGKLDAKNPLQGVDGKHVLLGTVTFGRLQANPPRFDLALGRAASYANFVTTAGVVLDTAKDGVVFQSVTPDPNDTDLDGLPDSWEIRYFGSIEKAYWSDDPDGDGSDNLHEYLADTNPTDKTSYLRIRSISSMSGGVSIEWMGGIESTQYLQRCLTLDATNPLWQDVFTNPPPTPVASSNTQFLGTNNLMFYRIRATR